MDLEDSIKVLLIGILVVMGVMGCVAGIVIGNQILHEHTQTITVAMVDPYSHQVMDTSGAIRTLNVNGFEMQTIRPGDILSISWRGGDWLPFSASDADVISGLRDPSSLTNTSCAEATL